MSDEPQAMGGNAEAELKRRIERRPSVGRPYWSLRAAMVDSLDARRAAA